jgi:hypothetical protein
MYRVRKLIIKTGYIYHCIYFLFSGTLISAFAVFCCGKHDYEKNIVAFFYNLIAAISQSATIFLLVGWIWSIRWGILFVQLSGRMKNATIENSKQKDFDSLICPCKISINNC